MSEYTLVLREAFALPGTASNRPAASALMQQLMFSWMSPTSGAPTDMIAEEMNDVKNTGYVFAYVCIALKGPHRCKVQV